MQIKDEVKFLSDNLDFIICPDISIKSYYSHRLVLFVMLMFTLFFESAMVLFLCINKEYLLIEMSQN